MLDQNLNSETSTIVIETKEYNRLTNEGLKFSLEVYKKTLERNQRLAAQNEHLQARLADAKPNYVHLIITLSWITAAWHLANQLINK